jgi:hypothetical protein
MQQHDIKNSPHLHKISAKTVEANLGAHIPYKVAKGQELRALGQQNPAAPGTSTIAPDKATHPLADRPASRGAEERGLGVREVRAGRRLGQGHQGVHAAERDPLAVLLPDPQGADGHRMGPGHNPPQVHPQCQNMVFCHALQLPQAVQLGTQLIHEMLYDDG